MVINSLQERLEKVLSELKLSPPSIKKVSELYFEAKKDIFNDEEIGKTESLIAVNIFLESYGFVCKYLVDKGRENLTDRELDLLLILCDEASANFEYLTEIYSSSDERISSIFTKENNEEKQKKIQDCRGNILEEKAKRKVQQNQQNQNSNFEFENEVNNEKIIFQDESLRKRINELEKRIKNLKNKNKITEADKLQKRVNIIKLNNPTKDNPTKNDNHFSLNGFFIGCGVALVVSIVLFFLVMNGRKKK